MTKRKFIVQVDKDKCTGCGSCFKKCFKIDHPKRCSGCGKCISVCSVNAISLVERTDNDKRKLGAFSINKLFDKLYDSFLHFLLSDIRMPIPIELKELVITCKPKKSLELGCGIGQFSSFLAKQEIEATGVDFSSVAIKQAKERVADDTFEPTFIVGNVTNLYMLNETFDISFDIGCFHYLYEDEQLKYISEVARLLKPGAIHLLWALDSTPNKHKFSPEYIADVFGNEFQLANSTFSRRRIIASHWYWLVRK